MDTPRRAGLPQAIVIISIGILPMMAIVTLMPIVPALVQRFGHVDGIEALAPLVLSAPGLCVALFSPFAGALTDRIGRRRLLLIFTTLYGVGGVLPFFVESFEMLIAGRLLLGVGEAFILTVGNALLGDYFENEARAKWLMWQAIVGPIVGVGLVAASGRLLMVQWNLPFLIYGVALIIAAIAYFAAYEPARDTGPKANEPGDSALMAIPTRLMLRLAITTFVLSAIYFVYQLQFTLVLDVMGVKKGSDLGFYSAIASIGLPVGSLLFKFIAGRRTELQFTVLFLLLGTGLIGIGMNLGLAPTIAFAFVEQMAAGMVIPVLVGWGLRELPEHFRGRGMGWWSSAFFLGQFISPVFVAVMRSITGGLLQAFLVFGGMCIAIALANILRAPNGRALPGKDLVG